jgi:hypothetical protein
VIPCFAAGQAGIRRRFDPYRPWVSLLLHCDGADESTSFPDHGPHNKTVTVIGDAQVDTSHVKWHGALHTQGTGDGISVPNGGHFDFGSGDFWVETCLENSGGTNNVAFIGAWGSGALSWVLYKNAGGANAMLYMSSNGSSWDVLSSADTGAVAASMSAYAHFAVGRKGSAVGVWKDGVSASTHAVGSASLYAGGSNLYISIDSAAGASMSGWQDEVRVLKGVCPNTPGQTFLPNAAAWADAG